MKIKTIVIWVIVFVALVLLVGSFKKYRPDLKLIDSIVASRQAEILKEKDDQIIQLNGKIELINAQLESSQKKYKEVKNKLSVLEHQAQSIQLPGSANETRERFRKLGYVPK